MPSAHSPAAGFQLRQNVRLAPFTTFGIGGEARWFAPIATEDELRQACAWAERQGVPVFVLGGGSNVLIDDSGFAGLVLHMQLTGVDEQNEGERRIFRVGAGEDWDALVTRTVMQDCAGMECLAGIPGSVGGTPVQNVGAYGQEVAQTIVLVRCFDRSSKTFVDFSKEDCRFAYRTSRLNTEPDRGRYIVVNVSFALTPGGPPLLEYADLKRHFAGSETQPSLTQVAEAVRSIRRAKGMVVDGGPLALRDPDTRSAGSFFKNPVVSADHYAKIAASVAPLQAPCYPAPDASGESDGRRRKIPAAWLLEQAGFAKGFAIGGAALSSKHTLALTNHSGHAGAAEILALRDRLIAGVEARFGIVLEPEPVFVSAAGAVRQAAAESLPAPAEA